MKYIKVCIFWNCIQYTIHEINVKNIFFKQNKRYENCHFFLLRAQIHHSFTINLRFFYGLKHKVRLSNTVWDFPFLISFRFNQRFPFLFIKMDVLFFWLQNVIISFKIKIIEKFCSQTSEFWVATRSFKIQWYLRELERPEN